jgi:hypothetical protein
MSRPPSRPAPALEESGLGRRASRPPARWLAGRRPRAARTSDGTPSTRLAPGLVLLGTATRLCTSPLCRRPTGPAGAAGLLSKLNSRTFARLELSAARAARARTYSRTYEIHVQSIRIIILSSYLSRTYSRGARTSCMHGSNHRSDGQVRRRRRSTS